MEPSSESVRIDRWLWAARLVKTRALAVEAIKGGRVELNDERAKPSKDVRPGDRVEISSGALRRCVIVRATAVRRGPASAAAQLYEETAESLEARERLTAERRLAGASGPRGGARPTKRDRRRLDAARRGRA
jgi:ribosome-associated heat shock protein Hsp15